MDKKWTIYLSGEILNSSIRGIDATTDTITNSNTYNKPDQDDFEKLEIPVFVATDDGSQGFHGLVTDAFYEYLNDFPADKANIYTCGPNQMMQAITEFANSAGISCQISVESKMGCGFGVCLGCSVMTKSSNRLACTDGPVFDANEFVWEKNLASLTSG